MEKASPAEIKSLLRKRSRGLEGMGTRKCPIEVFRGEGNHDIGEPCGLEVPCRTAYTETNMGRRFYCCDHKERHNPGNRRHPQKWFVWIDPENVSRAEIADMIKEYEEELDDMKKALNETREIVQGILDKWEAEADFQHLAKIQKT